MIRDFLVFFVFLTILACSRSSMSGGSTDASGTNPPVDARSADLDEAGLPVDAQSQEAGSCGQTSCLGGHRYLYQANRLWRPGAGSQLMPLAESDYQPVTDGPSYLLSFSPNGEAVVVAEVDGADVWDAAGAAIRRTDAAVTYDLNDRWAGAELVVSFGTELGAEVTIFGSGLPIVLSTRGTMSLTTSYAPVGETCALPLTLPYDGYVPATYSNALANTGASPVTCAGVRDGYCDAKCAGWLVADLPWGDLPTAAAYDPVTQILVGWKSGEEAYGICHGTFPPWPAMGPAGTRARWTGRAGANDTFHCRRSGLTPLPWKLDMLADSAGLAAKGSYQSTPGSDRHHPGIGTEQGLGQVSL